MRSIASLVLAAALGLIASTQGASAHHEHHHNYASPVLLARQFKALTYKGCYSSAGSLKKNTTYTFNTQGYCQTQCVPGGFTVEGVTNGKDCYCGDEVPPDSDKVDDDECDTPCAGFGEDDCGGKDTFSVYLTGYKEGDDVPEIDASKASSASPSVITLDGETMTVTADADSDNKDDSGGGASKAGIAAGVVVGALVISGMAGAGFYFWRNKKKRAAEDAQKQAMSVNDFIEGGKKSPSSGAGSFDTHLDPSMMAARRDSCGSLADDQDYSRRILKVTNA